MIIAITSVYITYHLIGRKDKRKKKEGRKKSHQAVQCLWSTEKGDFLRSRLPPQVIALRRHHSPQEAAKGHNPTASSACASTPETVILLVRDDQSMHKDLVWEGSPILQQQLFSALISPSVAEAANLPPHRPRSPNSHFFHSCADRHFPHLLHKRATLYLINTHAAQRCSVHI